MAVNGTVNANAVGTYTLTYMATDAAGNAATAVTRAVKVVAQPASGGGAFNLWMLFLLSLFIIRIRLNQRSAT